MDIHPSRVGGWSGGTPPGEGDVESRPSGGHGDFGRKELDVGITPSRPTQKYSRGGIEALAAAVVGEAMVALVLADAFLEKFGGDAMSEIRRNFDSYVAYLSERGYGGR